ncbi:MAG: hypothetical protein H6706_10755 [Myxococcales bacterium]|nr:hypothetical protein [Myxococcales bacterium]
MTTTTRTLACLLLACGLVACGEDKGGTGGAGGGGGADAGLPDAATCADFPDEHTALLNAPTEATVIQKVPTHPPVGAEGLP